MERCALVPGGTGTLRPTDVPGAPLWRDAEVPGLNRNPPPSMGEPMYDDAERRSPSSPTEPAKAAELTVFPPPMAMGAAVRGGFGPKMESAANASLISSGFCSGAGCSSTAGSCDHW
eukprot:Amastigsp_a841554_96.p3 type:complete len:117 gc:universal Amastigsp_a841554_96:1389-1039(-)